MQTDERFAGCELLPCLSGLNDGLPAKESERVHVWTTIYAFMMWPADDDNVTRERWLSYRHFVQFAALKTRLSHLKGRDELHHKRERKRLKAMLMTLQQNGLPNGHHWFWAVTEGCREDITKIAKAKMKHQLTASFVAARLVGMRIAQLETPSVKKAANLVAELDVRSSYKIHGVSRIYQGTSNIINSWSQYKAVAHLWLAMLLLVTKPEREDAKSFSEQFHNKHLDAFLYLARRFQNELLAARQTSHVASDPKIEMWLVPEELHIDPPDETMLPALSEQEIDWLRKLYGESKSAVLPQEETAV